MGTENAFTTLDSLLLLRYLQIHGIEPGSFANVSQLLENSKSANGIKALDRSNLNPGSLEDLYEELLKDEETCDYSSSIIDHEQRDSKALNYPRKRKMPGSNSPVQHGRIESDRNLQKLISKLYAQYRKDVVKRVTDDEKRILQLQREIESIERGSWDVKWQRLSNSARFGMDARPTSSKTEVKGSQAPATNDSPSPINTSKGELLASRSKLQGKANAGEGQTIKNSVNIYTSKGADGAATITDGLTHNLPHNRLTDENRQRKLHYQALNRSHQASATSDHQYDNAGIRNTDSKHHGSSHVSSNLLPQENDLMRQNVHFGGNRGTEDGMTVTVESNISSHNSHLDTSNIPLSNHLKTQRTSQTSDVQIKLVEKNGQLAYSPQTGVSNSNEHSQAKYFGDVPQKYTLSSSNYQNFAKAPHSTPLDPPLTNIRDEPSEAVLSPQQALEHQTLHEVQDTGALKQSSNPVMSPPFTPSRLITAAKPQTDQTSKGSPVSSSVGSSNGIERSTRQSNEPSSVTKWRNVELRSPASTQPLPRPRSFSPISDHEKMPANPGTVEKRKGWKARTLPRRLLTSQEGHNGEGNVHQTRSGLRRGARIRTSSATSSAVSRPPKPDKRTPSVASHNDTTSIEDSLPGGKEVKAEPSTPLAAESPSSQQRFTPELPRTRSRRNAPQPLKLASSSTGRRRRRSLRQASVPDSTASSTSMPNRAYIAASKSFQRTSAPLMNEIMTHKHASLFSAPVKEKNAEGYRDVIFQPQDLKSIRSAISAGARAVAAAAAASAAVAVPAAASNADNMPAAGSPMAPGSSGGSSGTLLLPLSPDLIPPRGIVNSTQLEQELMRMFANAVMFNPGDDGVVKDTREMFEAVTAAVDSWKQAERAAESRGRQADDDEELIGTPEEDSRGRRKR